MASAARRQPLALVEEAEGRSRVAARLLGACRVIEKAVGAVSRGRILSREVDACRCRVADALSVEVLAEQGALGRSMGIAEALDDAGQCCFGETDLERQWSESPK